MSTLNPSMKKMFAMMAVVGAGSDTGNAWMTKPRSEKFLEQKLEEHKADSPPASSHRETDTMNDGTLSSAASHPGKKMFAMMMVAGAGYDEGMGMHTSRLSTSIEETTNKQIQEFDSFQVVAFNMLKKSQSDNFIPRYMMLPQRPVNKIPAFLSQMDVKHSDNLHSNAVPVPLFYTNLTAGLMKPFLEFFFNGAVRCGFENQEKENSRRLSQCPPGWVGRKAVPMLGDPELPLYNCDVMRLTELWSAADTQDGVGMYRKMVEKCKAIGGDRVLGATVVTSTNTLVVDSYTDDFWRGRKIVLTKFDSKTELTSDLLDPNCPYHRAADLDAATNRRFALLPVKQALVVELQKIQGEMVKRLEDEEEREVQPAKSSLQGSGQGIEPEAPRKSLEEWDTQFKAEDLATEIYGLVAQQQEEAIAWDKRKDRIPKYLMEDEQGGPDLIGISEFDAPADLRPAFETRGYEGSHYPERQTDVGLFWKKEKMTCTREAEGAFTVETGNGPKKLANYYLTHLCKPTSSSSSSNISGTVQGQEKKPLLVTVVHLPSKDSDLGHYRIQALIQLRAAVLNSKLMYPMARTVIIGDFNIDLQRELDSVWRQSDKTSSMGFDPHFVYRKSSAPSIHWKQSDVNLESKLDLDLIFANLNGSSKQYCTSVTPTRAETLDYILVEKDLLIGLPDSDVTVSTTVTANNTSLLSRYCCLRKNTCNHIAQCIPSKEVPSDHVKVAANLRWL